MTSTRLASVVINNFNYGRYLPEAIESALGQTYPHVEVIVVDDGSTDNSLDVLRPYADRVRIITQENGGQASSFNVGFRESAGDLVCFLDSDDALLPTVIEAAMGAFGQSTAKVHWPLLNIDSEGHRTGGRTPDCQLPEGDLGVDYSRLGPEAHAFPPTSGNAWSRRCLENLFPLPTPRGFHTGGADKYLSMLIPLFGEVRRVAEPQALYRLHGRNNYASLSFEDKLTRQLWCYDYCCEALAKYCRSLGIRADPDSWRRGSWIHRVRTLREELRQLIAPGETYILVDEGHLGPNVVPGARALPLVERQGLDYGPPANDAIAIAELEQRRHAGASFIVFAWPAFWWLDHYAIFRDDLERRFRCILTNERATAYDMRAGRREPA